MWRLTAGLSVTVVLLSGWAYITHLRLSAARADLAAARQTVEAYKEAAVKLDEHLQRQAEDAAKWRAIEQETDVIGGADETLNDYERAVLDRVRQ
jgi:hypothetical protein